jgi:cobalt/nickel transport system ATP-binding protein
MTGQSILKTKELDFSYPNGVLALKNVSMDIEKGKKIAFLGPNGAGKSTLFLHFNGILRPKNGEVLFEGTPLRYDQKSLATLRKQVALVLQNPDDQIFSTTVEEDVAFGPMNLSLPREEVERRVDDAMRLVGLEGLRERPTQQLSFGERKRVALAGALSMEPKVLIMDEPTAGLDSRMVRELLELADELNQRGLTVIMSTHDVETAYSWADEIRILHQGRLEFSGLPEEFFKDGTEVHERDLVPPMLFELNKHLNRMRGEAEEPYPRTPTELVQKIFPENMKETGKGTIIAIGSDSGSIKSPATIQDSKDNSKSIGVYGTAARRFVEENGIPVDYKFDAFENCILGASEGGDFLLYIDSRLAPLIESKFRKLENCFGLAIERRYIGLG